MADFLIENNFLISTAEPGASQEVAPLYQVKCGISLGANRGFYMTFWVEKNGQMMTANLGSASYQVFNADRVDSATLEETGLTADANGIYKITPVDGSELIDLTHYTVRLTASADGQNRVSMWSFSLGE